MNNEETTCPYDSLTEETDVLEPDTTTKVLYHGTTYENYLNIKENGFGSLEKTWNCSSPETMYFYDTDKTEEDDEEYKESYCVSRAFESAQITAAVHGVNSSKLVVLRLEIDSDHVRDDYSCENMSDVATEAEIEDLNEFGVITEVFICEEGYNPALRFFYICHLWANNEYLHKTHFTHLEDKALQLLADKETGIFIDELLDFEWEAQGIEIKLNG